MASMLGNLHIHSGTNGTAMTIDCLDVTEAWETLGIMTHPDGPVSLVNRSN